MAAFSSNPEAGRRMPPSVSDNQKHVKGFISENTK
jgi:hypothetical protein